MINQRMFSESLLQLQSQVRVAQETGRLFFGSFSEPEEIDDYRFLMLHEALSDLRKHIVQTIEQLQNKNNHSQSFHALPPPPPLPPPRPLPPENLDEKEQQQVEKSEEEERKEAPQSQEATPKEEPSNWSFVFQQRSADAPVIDVMEGFQVELVELPDPPLPNRAEPYWTKITDLQLVKEEGCYRIIGKFELYSTDLVFDDLGYLIDKIFIEHFCAVFGWGFGLAGNIEAVDFLKDLNHAECTLTIDPETNAILKISPDEDCIGKPFNILGWLEWWQTEKARD